jgi:hypothetical protein
LFFSESASSRYCWGGASDPSRRPIAWAPRTAGRACIFQKRKFSLVSFSVGGAPRAAARAVAAAADEVSMFQPIVIGSVNQSILERLIVTSDWSEFFSENADRNRRLTGGFFRETPIVISDGLGDFLKTTNRS